MTARAARGGSSSGETVARDMLCYVDRDAHRYYFDD